METLDEKELFDSPATECNATVDGEKCDSIFWRKTNIIKHMVIKEGEDPQIVNIPCFICEKCGNPLTPR